MSNLFKIKPSESQHFMYNDKEFEIRITDDGDKLEIWEVGFDVDGETIGFTDIVAEFNLEVKDEI